MSATLDTPATDQRQSHTLSIRITDTMRHRLERAQQLAAITGRSVYMSDIAKQLLESARENRLEVVDLLDAPTETLVQVRRKGEAGVALSRVEWTVLAHFVRHGSIHVRSRPHRAASFRRSPLSWRVSGRVYSVDRTARSAANRLG